MNNLAIYIDEYVNCISLIRFGTHMTMYDIKMCFQTNIKGLNTKSYNFNNTFKLDIKKAHEF